MKVVFYAILMGACIFSKVLAGGGCLSCSVNATCSERLCPVAVGPFSEGQSFSQDLSFRLSPGIDTNVFNFQITAPVIGVSLMDVSGLPEGVSWSCSSLNCRYYPTFANPDSRYGCISICGNPCGASDTLAVAVVFRYTFDPPAFVLGLPDTVNLFDTLRFSFMLSSATPRLTIISNSDFLCPAGAGSSLTLAAPTGFSTYSWSTGDASNSITVLSAGTYSITATNATGCSQEDSKEIAILNASVSSALSVCSHTIVQLQADGGDNFLWSPAAYLSSASEQNPVVSGIENSTHYSVTVSNGNCSDTAGITISIDNSTCAGICGRCVPVSASCADTTAPFLCNSLPDIQGGVPYDETLTFSVPPLVEFNSILPFRIPIEVPGIPTHVKVKSVVINGIDNLPLGLHWECDQAGTGCTYYPALHPSITQYGCLRICGTTCGNGYPETFALGLNTTIEIELPQYLINYINGVTPFNGTVPVTLSFSARLQFAVDLEIMPNPAVLVPGGTLTLTATSTGFSDHVWSTGAAGASITVDTAGSYTVQANDGSCSQTATVQVVYGTGIHDQSSESPLMVYPSPGSGSIQLSFHLETPDEITVSIFTPQGQRVFSEIIKGASGSNTFSLSLASLPKGIYMVKAASPEGARYGRIVIF